MKNTPTWAYVRLKSAARSAKVGSMNAIKKYPKDPLKAAKMNLGWDSKSVTPIDTTFNFASLC